MIVLWLLVWAVLCYGLWHALRAGIEAWVESDTGIRLSDAGPAPVHTPSGGGQDWRRR